MVDGTLIFYETKMNSIFDLKIFLDTDDDIRLSRRIYKDVCIRKKSLNSAVDKYLKQCKKGYDKYTLPSKKYADIIIPNYGEGYSTVYKDDAFAGFSNLEGNFAIDLVLNQIS